MSSAVELKVLAQSPSSTTTPLQIVCFFDQTKNQTYAGGTAAVDEHFGGRLRKLRAADVFRGNLLETLLLVPQKKEIPAEKLLLVGLGDPASFTPAIFEKIGHLVIFEAMKLGVESLCFAPSIKDAGLMNIDVAAVSSSLSKGMDAAIAAGEELAKSELIPAFRLKEVNLLASPAHVENAQLGLKK